MDGEAERAWLQRRHDAVRTPRAVIEARIRAAAGAGMASFERLVVGEDNEVYDVTTTAGERLIVRISHAEDPRFEAERWALDAARAAGVPTPVVRHLEAVTLADGRAVTCCVEERLPGTPLDVLLRNGIRPSRAIAELGDLLAAIHGIPVDGFGYLRPDGRGWPITFASMMTDLVPRRDRVLAAARHWRVDDQLVLAGLDLLAGHTDCYRYDEPRLVHGTSASTTSWSTAPRGASTSAASSICRSAPVGTRSAMSPTGAWSATTRSRSPLCCAGTRVGRSWPSGRPTSSS